MIYLIFSLVIEPVDNFLRPSATLNVLYLYCYACVLKFLPVTRGAVPFPGFVFDVVCWAIIMSFNVVKLTFSFSGWLLFCVLFKKSWIFIN